MESLGLFGLFILCALGSSLYPLASEVFVVGFLALDYTWWVVWIVATCGNTLGALSTYAIGYFSDSYVFARFQNAYAKLHRYEQRMRKFGALYAFFSFLPIVGDVFALGLGVYKYSIPRAIFFIAFGKGVRYAALIYATLWYL